MNIKQSFLAMDACFAAGLTPHFIGLHGIGKSAVMYQYASANGYEVVEIRVGLMADAGDLVGIQEFLKCKNTGEALSTRHVLPDWFMKAVVQISEAGANQKPVIIFIDELNRGHKDLLQAIFELVYDRSLKGVKMRKGCQVVAASNPPTEDYSVLDFDDSAFQDRFVHIKFEPTKEEWLTYIKEAAPTSTVGDFIAEYPQMLENAGLKSFSLDFVKPSRRSWDRITKLEAVKCDPSIELELFMGIVGLEPALAYTKFRETNFKAIRGEQVLNEYKTVRKEVKAAIKKNRTDLLGTVNQELDELFKTMTSLTNAQAENLSEFVNDLPAEHAYALAIIVKNNTQCTLNIVDVDVKKLTEGAEKMGMFGYTKFVNRVLAVQTKREEAKKQTEAVAT